MLIGMTFTARKDTFWSTHKINSAYRHLAVSYQFQLLKYYINHRERFITAISHANSVAITPA
jgi:hypothetical protein